MSTLQRGIAIIATIAAIGLVGTVFGGLFGDLLIERSSKEADAFSRSALGHLGFLEWLKLRGHAPIILRSPTHLASARESNLFALEPRADDPVARLHSTRLADREEATLLVLPRRVENTEPRDMEQPVTDPNWILAYSELSVTDVGRVAELAGVNLTVERATSPVEFHFGPDATVLELAAPQCVRSDEIVPIVAAESGILFGLLTTRPNVYVLADPDLIANHGIVDPTDRAFLDFVLERMSISAGTPIAIDETIHGETFERDIWREALTMPLLPVTLSALLVAVMAVLAARRFLAPLATSTPWSAGKRALIDNTAELEATADRLDPLVHRYQAILEQSLAESLGIEGGLNATDRRSEIERRVARLGNVSSPPRGRNGSRVLRNNRAGVRDALATARAWKLWHDEVIGGTKRN